VHPFDLRAATFAKHAQHVVIIHFPIALFIVGVAFDYAGQPSGKAALISAAYYNLLVAALSAIPAVATGLLAWQWQFDGRRLHGILLLHLVLGTVGSEEARVKRWPPSAAQTARTVFPYAAFTKTQRRQDAREGIK
jgi:hypothetical protein